MKTPVGEPIQVPESDMLTEIMEGGPSLEGINRDLVRTIGLKLTQIVNHELEIAAEESGVGTIDIEAIKTEPKQP